MNDISVISINDDPKCNTFSKVTFENKFQIEFLIVTGPFIICFLASFI